MSSRFTWHCGLVLLLGIGMFAGCKPSGGPDSDAVQADSTAPEAEDPQAQDFERSLEGIWSTGVSSGDDAETIYAIEWQPSGLRIMRDGTRLEGAVEDVDFDNQTLAFHITRENAPSETVTLRKVRDATAGEGFTLRLTWAQGQAEELGFVRRLTTRDRQEIGMAITQAGTAGLLATACDSDAQEGSLRATLACNHDEFAALDRGLRIQLVELAARYPDGDRTAAAVVRQLDACATPACLRDVYARWQAYFDENYDLGDVLDYH